MLLLGRGMMIVPIIILCRCASHRYSLSLFDFLTAPSSDEVHAPHHRRGVPRREGGVLDSSTSLKAYLAVRMCFC